MDNSFFKRFLLRNNSIIICKGCEYKIDLNIVPEEKMGYTRCPNCKALVDNEGFVIKEKN